MPAIKLEAGVPHRLELQRDSAVMLLPDFGDPPGAAAQTKRLQDPGVREQPECRGGERDPENSFPPIIDFWPTMFMCMMSMKMSVDASAAWESRNHS